VSLAVEPPPPAVEFLGIGKRFGEVVANHGIDLVVRPGTVHGLVGENGAGKSTLMSILYGLHAPDVGEIRIHGRRLPPGSARAAIAAGIGMVHQHFMLVETMTVLENVMLGADAGWYLGRSERELRARMAGLSRDYGLEVDPDAVVSGLPVGLRQRVEIIKLLLRDADILVLDEPTAVLTPDEAGQLFAVIRRLREAGRTIILVTHKLREVMALTDMVSVMRRGEMVITLTTAETRPEALAEAMVGRKVQLTVAKGPADPGEVLLAAESLRLREPDGHLSLDDVSLTVRAGEIVGIAGVTGSGQGALLEVLSGMRRPTSGRVMLAGRDATRDGSRGIRRRRLGHIPEDRHRNGLVLPFQACESAILGWQHAPELGFGPLLSRARMRRHAAGLMQAYDVRPPDPLLASVNFSGGNQQKIVVAREVERAPLVLLVGQPSRGVDIGAIEFIHRRLVALRDAGCAVLLVSVELDEILALSDRILVMCGGVITGERRPHETDERDLGLLMAGIRERAA